jgi:hypothetical protein
MLNYAKKHDIRVEHQIVLKKTELQYGRDADESVLTDGRID